MASTDTHKRKAYRAPDKPSLEIADYTGWRSLLNPLWCYHGFRMAIVRADMLGLIMVFSSCRTVTVATLGKSPFLQLLNQGAFCLIGLVLGFVALMMPVTLWKRTGVFFVVGACLSQALTLLPFWVTTSTATEVGWTSASPLSSRRRRLRDVHRCLVVGARGGDLPREGNQGAPWCCR